MKKKTFNIGDKVKVVNYGALVFEAFDCDRPLPLPVYKEDKEQNYRAYDIRPELVGRMAIIAGGSDKHGYSLQFKDDEISWFNLSQLELINKNPNML